MIIDIFLIIISIIISMIGITFLYFNRENFGNKLNVILNGSIYIVLGIFFFTFFFLSTEVYFTEDIVLIFWYLSIGFWVISLSMLGLIQKYIINFEKRATFSTLFYSLIVGIILGLSFIPDSFKFQLNSGIFSYKFENFYLLLLLLFYNFFIIGVMCYNLIKYFSRIRNKRSKQMLITLTSNFSIIIIIFSVYIVFQNIIIKYLYSVFYIIGASFASYYLINKPSLFIELTNKIYDFIIFHRSGILLYSYNFETGEATDESLLKGSILIGINHILSNFINKKDQLGLIKMQNRDIILEYDNTHGYALLLTTNHKNSFIDKAVHNFMRKFTILNGEKLQNLNGLIDVSEFRNAKDIILEFFEPYII
ncbi:MAG: hypothetical protein JSV62_01960 [Promethearchaeota archaeon]|nr:MAG: hypothetical protein JSV62_01960 [Candidatus Lokiarchaeota archaeon]